MADTKPLPRSSPAAEQFDSSGIISFIDGINKRHLGAHSIMIVHHGKVIAEGWWKPYRADRRHLLYSLSKSFTSTAVGLAISEGLLTLDDNVIDFFPNDLPETVSPNLAAMKIRHLLSMSAGQKADDITDLYRVTSGNWPESFLARPVADEPGTTFAYNSTATYMLSAIVQKLTGLTLLEYLKPRLFYPLGIEDVTSESCPQGVNTGGWGMSLTTEAIAKFGLLYHQDGVWEGHRLLPEGWVAEATRKHISNGEGEPNDWNQGYGFKFWRCRNGAYRGDGAFGQYCVVMPEQDLVLAVTSGSPDMAAILDLAWQYLLPSVGKGGTRDGELIEQLKSLDLASDGATTGAVTSGTYKGTGPFESITFEIEADTVTLRIDEKEVIVAGTTDWIESVVNMGPLGLRQVGCRAAWTSESTLVVEVNELFAPSRNIVTCTFDGSKVHISCDLFGFFGPNELPPFDGERVS